MHQMWADEKCSAVVESRVQVATIISCNDRRVNLRYCHERVCWTFGPPKCVSFEQSFQICRFDDFGMLPNCCVLLKICGVIQPIVLHMKAHSSDNNPWDFGDKWTQTFHFMAIQTLILIKKTVYGNKYHKIFSLKILLRLHYGLSWHGHFKIPT